MECYQKGTAYGEIKTAFGDYLPGFHGNFNCRRYCFGGDWNGGSNKAFDGGLVLPDGGAGGILWVSDVFEWGEEETGGGERVGWRSPYEKKKPRRCLRASTTPLLGFFFSHGSLLNAE